MLMPSVPLLAAGLDWLEGLLPLLFVMIWIVSQVWGVFRKVAGNGNAKPPKAGPVPRPAPRPVPQAPWLEEEPLPADANLRGELEKQIEEFLRETGRSSPSEPRSAPKRPTPARSARQLQTSSQTQRPRAEARTSAPAAPPRLTSAADGPARERAIGSLAERTSDIARHVEDAFADDLVHRRAAASTANAERSGLDVQSAAPLDLVRLLRNPATLRQLVLVREVLDRPVDRW
jgi:hypothetical protein